MAEDREFWEGCFQLVDLRLLWHFFVNHHLLDWQPCLWSQSYQGIFKKSSQGHWKSISRSLKNLLKVSWWKRKKNFSLIQVWVQVLKEFGMVFAIHQVWLGFYWSSAWFFLSSTSSSSTRPTCSTLPSVKWKVSSPPSPTFSNTFILISSRLRSRLHVPVWLVARQRSLD